MEHKEEEKKHHYLRREFSYTNYEQNYTLPEDVDKDNIAAKVEHGILTITLPRVQKEEQKLSRNIAIC
jgi:HSP20 family protein